MLPLPVCFEYRMNIQQRSAASPVTASERPHEYSAGVEVARETGLRFPSGHCVKVIQRHRYQSASMKNSSSFPN